MFPKPLAEYLGFEEYTEGFPVYTPGTGDLQYMAIDSDGDIVGDTTLGTKRSRGALSRTRTDPETR